MAHLPDLIRDLGLILITAAAVTLLFRKLRQPLVLGYLIAGFLMSPHVPFMPSIADSHSIQVWAEIGVIFLLFALGLEFSFKKLVRVGRSASLTAFIEVLFMLGVGYLVGQALTWSTMDSLFLGGILAISSTTIIVRAFDELGLKTSKFVGLVFGVLIVEDLFAILLLALLSTVAVTQTLSGTALFQATVKLSFFLILWFVVGIYLIPVVLRKIRDLMTEETTLIVSLGLCLMMVILATSVGFSPALGAFVMGSILAETREGRTIEHLIVPVKNLFAAIFFVSVGMLIDPKMIVEHAETIALLTVVTIVGKFLSTTVGALVSGQSLKHSVRAGMSLAQIGEFSFIIATLGTSLKVTSEFLYPLAVAVSAITTFLTPYQIKYSHGFYEWLKQRLPENLLVRIDRYHQAVTSQTAEGPAALLWRLYGLKILLNSVVIIAIGLSAGQFLYPLLVTVMNDSIPTRIVAAFLTILMAAPFFWPIFFSTLSAETLKRLPDVTRLKSLQFGLILVRNFIGVVLIGFVVSQFLSWAAATGLIIISITLTVTLLGRNTEHFYQFFERRFLSNLQEKEAYDSTHLAPWDANLVEFTLSADSPIVGKTLMDSQIKERFGVMVVLIERGRQRIMAPGRDFQLLPNDRLFVIGREEQLESARAVIETKPSPDRHQDEEHFGLELLVIGENSPFHGKPIRSCGLRERINGLIVGIERNNQRLLNPDSALELATGDLVWVVGNVRVIKELGGA